jgi:hypothetical protein
MNFTEEERKDMIIDFVHSAIALTPEELEADSANRQSDSPISAMIQFINVLIDFKDELYPNDDRFIIDLYAEERHGAPYIKVAFNIPE